MFCPKCKGERRTSPDILNNQPVDRCVECGRVLSAGTVLPGPKVQPLSLQERYRPCAKDGVSRSVHSPKFLRNGASTVEVIVVLAVVAILVMVGVSIVRAVTTALPVSASTQ